MLANLVSPNDDHHPSALYSGPTQPIPKKSLQIRTDKPRPHVCAICTRGFARLEHLKRHERSHTNEKPFQCAACGRCFARRDLVLRHQQKLHLHMLPGMRRSLVATAVSEGLPPPGSDNIIILRNNTHAKAPLPNGLLSDVGGANLSALTPLHMSASPHDFHLEKVKLSFAYLGLHGAMPLPNTVSSHNTPSAPSKPAATSHPADDSAAPDPVHRLASYTQQPSPLTGDSPDLKEKKRAAWPGLAEEAHPAHTTRHASFLAVLGVSYAKLKDALSIESHQIHDGPSQVGFSTPQLTATELDHRGLLVMDFGALDLDWYNLDLTDLKPDVAGANGINVSGLHGNGLGTNGLAGSPGLSGSPGFAGSPIMGSPGFVSSSSLSTGVTGSNLVSGALMNGTNRNYKAKSSNGATKLTTIPSESQLKLMDQSYFANPVLAGHQFLDSSHPHHIKGTTPIDFSFSPGGEMTHQMFESKDNHVGSSLVDLAQDIFGPGNSEVHISNTVMSPQNASVQPGSSHSTPQAFQGTPQPSQAASLTRASIGLATNKRGRRASPTKKPVKKQQASSVALSSDFKRAKLGFVNDTDDLGWVKDFQSIPVLNEFPSASHDTGFLGMPYIADQFEPDEILTLFKSRQEDLVQQRTQVDPRPSPSGSGRLSISTSRMPSKALFTIGDRDSFVTEELRNRIISVSKLTNTQFPPLEDLNAYMNLYEKEFNRYFPFIHMPTLRNPMVDNFETIPLILSMCSIGALYSYHDNNTLLLFNLSKYHIHNFFEKEVTVDKLQFKKVPIMAHQCLVLHIFISMFLNEPNMVEITSRQMSSMVGLIKSTNFHRPLELFLLPPQPVKNPNAHVSIQQNFDYFIMAQTRIRTIHTFYLLEILRSTLLGLAPPMAGFEILSGTHCSNENLWKANNCTEWFTEYQKCGLPSIVELSNNEPLKTLIEHMNDSTHTDTGMSLNKAMVALVSVHEQILQETLAKSLDEGAGALDWRVNSRPKLENLIKSWECLFARSGGFSVVNSNNNHVLSNSSELKLILPLLSFAKIRLCVNITPVMKAVLYKDWKDMEELLSKLSEDVDGLKDATQHALDILNLWVQNISVLNDPKKTSVRTPVYFVTCTCIAVMVVAKVLNVLESSASLNVYEKSLWLNVEKVLRSIETALNPSEELNSYAEFLRKQSYGVFDSVWNPEFKQNVERVIQSVNNGDADSDAKVKKCNLLILALSLGVRILADAPLWPLAMGFAEALKNMATQIHVHEASQ